MNLKHMVAAITLGAAALAVGKPHPVPEGDDLSNFNLHPTEIYEVILTVYNAPGPLWPNDGSMGYTVISKCVPSGVGPWGYDTSTPLDTRWPNRRATRIYKTYIPRDLMLKKDYFGKGVCEWTMDDVELYMTNNGNMTTFINFTSKMDEYDIYSGRIVKTYFLKDQYRGGEVWRPIHLPRKITSRCQNWSDPGFSTLPCKPKRSSRARRCNAGFCVTICRYPPSNVFSPNIQKG